MYVRGSRLPYLVFIACLKSSRKILYPLTSPLNLDCSTPSDFKSYPQFSLDNSTAEIGCYDECLNCPVRIEDMI